MFEKIKKALTFRQDVFREVKNDAGFSGVAWFVIIASSLLSALGSNTSLLRAGHPVQWILGVAASSIVSVLGFALACHVIAWVSRYFFNSLVKYDEVLRTLGLARVWLGFTFIGILTAFTPSAACITGPVGLVAVGLTFFAWLMAIRQTLQLEWPQSLALIIIGAAVMIGVSIIINVILASIGLVSTSFLVIFQ